MKLKHPIKAILFDAVGTLIYPEPSVGEAYAAIGARHGCHLSPDETQSRFHKAFHRQEELDARNGYRTSEARELERWQTIVAEVFRDQPEPLAPFQELWDHFAKPEAWRCYPEVEGWFLEMAYFGWELGIASNYDCRLHLVAEGVSGLQMFKVRFSSAEIGWAKPAAEFFQTTCNKLGLQPHEILFVGDDLENDFLASQAVGMQAVLVDRQQKYRETSRVANLAELYLECLAFNFQSEQQERGSWTNRDG
jgi:putative hydrolase of the HAD superfamily